MSIKTDDQRKIREYLLGVISNHTERDAIEERLMIDDQFFEILLLEEEELIQDYADEDLTITERINFEKSFLISDERKEKVRFALALRKYVVERKIEKEVPVPETAETENEIKSVSFFQRLFANRAQLAFASLLFVILSSLIIWNFYPLHSENQPAMTALNRAYRIKRPFESRIAGFDYAPYGQMRGGQEEKVDTLERNRAERLILDEASERPTAVNLHSLGQLYLAKGLFDEALKELEKAGRIDPQNAEIINDIGVAYLEKSKIVSSENESGEKLELAAKALENFQNAIEINSHLLAARFNKAGCLQILQLKKEAAKAWQDYLELDADSPWAEESRQNLNLLKSSSSSLDKAPDGVLRDFQEAFRNKDDERAYKITSRNREMITGKLLPQQLAFLFLKTGGAENEYLPVLEYAGRVEQHNSNDSFFSEMAQFYSTASKAQQNGLYEAHTALRSGYQLSLQGKQTDALREFQSAQSMFNDNRDHWSAGICGYWIAYSFYRLNRLNQSTEILRELAYSNESYKWLTSHLLTLLATNMIASSKFSKALDYNYKALRLAEETSDLYNLQKTLSQRAEIYRRVGNYRQALVFTKKNLPITTDPDASLRQRWRDLDLATNLFFAMKLFAASASFEKEALDLAKDLQDDTFYYQSYVNLGLVYGAQGKRQAAFSLFEKARQTAAQFQEETVRRKSVANTNLQIAHLQRQDKNCREALSNYNEAIDFYDHQEFQVNQYDAHRGRMRCYLDTSDDVAFQTELSTILSLFRRYRENILEEQNRNSFFDNEQNVYDVAVEYEFNKGRVENAFDFSEESRARSLLDLQNSAAKIAPGDGAIPDVKFSPIATEPLKMVEIQAAIPENVQILQYTVLANKTLIWVINNNEFSVAETNISAENLQAKVTAYIELLTRGDRSQEAQENEAAKELYRLLIAPVENKLIAQKQICLIPDKVLFRLPFAALISSVSEQYFITQHTFFFSPSANIFLRCSQNAKKRRLGKAETLLSIGNPSFNQKDFPGLPDLASAEREAIDVAAFYKEKKLLLRKEAGKEKVSRELSNTNIIHFAGHYLVDERSPMLSSLVLAENPQTRTRQDSEIANYEIIAKKLSDARIIVLSACDTNADGYYAGEGPIGAARTFLAAGVPLVIASQWAVDSEATTRLMIQFHRYRASQRLSTVEALRRAQLDMLEGENPVFRKPVYWAAFTAFGGYAEF